MLKCIDLSFEIAREIKIKKQHKSFFEDTNVCIKSRPPTQNSSILSKWWTIILQRYGSMVLF